MTVLDTEAITARLKNATDYTGPIGDRVDFKAALLHAEFHAYAPGDIAALLAEVARLREALEPFAHAGHLARLDIPDSQATVYICNCPVRLSDLRNAATVMWGAALQAVEET